MKRAAIFPAVAAGCFLASGCATTYRTDIDVHVDARATRDGRVELVALGGTCDDELDGSFERDGSTFRVTARGSLPKKDGDYCERYIDTGGSSPGPQDLTTTVDLAPGVYGVVGDPGDSVTFLVRDGIVVSSKEVGSDSRTALELAVNERVQQRDATERFAHALAEHAPEWSTAECGPTDVGIAVNNTVRVHACEQRTSAPSPRGAANESSPVSVADLVAAGCREHTVHAIPSAAACTWLDGDGGQHEVHIAKSVEYRSGAETISIWIARSDRWDHVNEELGDECNPIRCDFRSIYSSAPTP